MVLHSDKSHDHTVYVDASLTGIGAIHNTNVYAATYPPGFSLVYTIVHLEMINIWVMLGVWGHLWKGKVIRVYCDNEAVVQVLGKGKTRDPYLMLYARSIWLCLASWDIKMQVLHIAGKLNKEADCLSPLVHRHG